MRKEKKQMGLMRVSHYARQQGVSTTHIYRLIHEGKLPVKKVDGVFFVDLESVNLK